MSDVEAQSAPDNPIAAPPPAESPASASDDIETLLQEYDSSGVSSGERPDEVAPEPPRTSSDDDVQRLLMEGEQQKAVLQELLFQQNMHAQRQQEHDDFNALMKEAIKATQGLPLPGEKGDFERRWLMAEYQLNADFKEAWDQRYDSDSANARCASVMKRALKSLAGVAKNAPDPVATEDRALVTAAVRGGTNAPPPAETDASYRRRVERMTDAEFNRMRDEMIGG